MNTEPNLNYCFQLEDDDKYIEKIGKALSSKIRIAIIRQLSIKPRSLTELAKLNDLPNSTILFHLHILIDAKLVEVHYRPNKKGSTQIFFLSFVNINLLLYEDKQILSDKYVQNMPVGLYTEACFDEYFRFATQTEFVRLDLNDTFNPLRSEARLLWTNGGKLTYSFGNSFAQKQPVRELQFSLEICSECLFFNNDWKSDVTFAVNNIELLTYTCPGDYGGIRGKLNPDWWADNGTQYGDLVTVAINDTGTYLNSVLVNDTITLSDLKITEGNCILFSFYTKKDAVHYGGFNVFGRSFGNHPQDIVLTALYNKSPSTPPEDIVR